MLVAWHGQTFTSELIFTHEDKTTDIIGIARSDIQHRSISRSTLGDWLSKSYRTVVAMETNSVHAGQ